MIKLMKGITVLLDKLGLYTLYGLMLFPILPRGVESILMTGFFTLSVISWQLDSKKNNINSKDLLFIALFSSVLLCYLISLLYSSNFQQGLKQIVRVIPLTLFPFIFGFFRKDYYLKEMNRLTNIYLFALFVGLLSVNIVFFEKLYFLENSHWKIRQEIEKFTDVHGTYISIWLGFGVLLLFSKALTKLSLNSLKNAIFYLTLMCYFVYGQITIGARMPFVITLVLTAGYFVYNFRSKKGIRIGFSFIAIVALFLLLSKSNIIDKLERVVRFEHSFPEGDYISEFKNISSEDIRKGIYYCSWILVEEAPFIGHGIGDVEEKLQNCYKEKIDSNVYQIFLYNSHNQYLQILMSTGVLALLFFVISLLVPVYISLKNNNYLLFSFTVLIIACFLTENVINRHDGVIFYSLFNSILIYNLKGNEESISS